MEMNDVTNAAKKATVKMKIEKSCFNCSPSVPIVASGLLGVKHVPMTQA
jgi:hypothetical protein